MRVLVIGQAGREHALVWRLAQSPSVTKVYCAPGNSGTGIDGENVAIAENDGLELAGFCRKQKIDLAVVGPEAPLVEGIADVLRKEGVAVFGPSKDAALLEGSKVFCKQILKEAKAPTADFLVCEDMDDVLAWTENRPGPAVVKADGLAAGKGVIVCDDSQEVLSAAKWMLVDNAFGAAGRRVVIEKRLDGQELSVLALVDGKTIVVLPACQDHKRALDNDQGPNTGGMGAYCPAPLATPELLAKVESTILVPVIHTLRSNRRPFRGLLYAGLMLTPAGPQVLEFNVRFGDPECQPLMLRWKSDLAAALFACANGQLDTTPCEWDDRPAVCVVLAAGGYPGAYRKGNPIRGLDLAAELPDVKVFHAGAKRDGDNIVTNGGRVLGVTALGADLADAKARAYQAVDKIKFADMAYRKDIADRGISK